MALVQRSKPMTKKLQAVYENGVLRPLEPLPLKEHQQVSVTISDAAAAADDLVDAEFLRDCEAQADDSGSNPCRRFRYPVPSLFRGRCRKAVSGHPHAGPPLPRRRATSAAVRPERATSDTGCPATSRGPRSAGPWASGHLCCRRS